VVSNARLLDASKLDTSKALVLSIVKIKNKSNGQTMTYTLVAENEADLKNGKISVSSPIGKGYWERKSGTSLRSVFLRQNGILKSLKSNAE